MRKILLVYPGRLYAPIWGLDTWNLKPALLNLYSYLRQSAELSVEVLDLEIELGNPRTKEEVEKFKKSAGLILKGKRFDIVAISCYISANYLGAKMVAEICRQANRDSVIAVGGHHASAMPADFMYEGSPFDFIVIGEGEKALWDICMNGVKRNQLPAVIKGDPLDLGKPFRLMAGEYKYAGNSAVHTLGFELSRGCVFNCSYCPSSTFNASWRSFSVRDSIKRIEEAIESVNPVKIGFMDPCFGFNKSWRRQLLRGIIKKKINQVIWGSPRIELLEKEDIDLAAKLNFYFDISLESGSEKMLHIMQRTARPKAYLKKCKEVIDYINRKKIPNNLFIVLNHPGEDLDTFKDCLEYIERLVAGAEEVSTKIVFAPFCMFPGTPAHRKIAYFQKRYGTSIRHKEWWKDEGCDQFILATGITASKKLNGINPYLYWREEFNRITDILRNKLSRERLGFDFALERMIYGDGRRGSFAADLNMYIPEFLFKNPAFER